MKYLNLICAWDKREARLLEQHKETDDPNFSFEEKDVDAEIKKIQEESRRQRDKLKSDHANRGKEVSQRPREVDKKESFQFPKKDLNDIEQVLHDMQEREKELREKNAYYDKKIQEEYKKFRKNSTATSEPRMEFAEAVIESITKANKSLGSKQAKKLIMQQIEHALKRENIFGSSGKEVKKLTQFPPEGKREEEANEYLDYLAKELDSPRKLGEFLAVYMSYRLDSPIPDKAPHMVGTPERKGEHWQRPQETIWRMVDGEMLGDCDDYAFLAREIVTRWEKPVNAHVVDIGTHALCMWVRQSSNGRWHAYTLGTYGMDHNGNRNDYNRFGEKISRSNNIYTYGGYKTIEKAINSVMEKYDKKDREYRVEKGEDIKILDVPKFGVEETHKMPLSLFEIHNSKELQDEISNDAKKYLSKHPYFGK